MFEAKVGNTRGDGWNVQGPTTNCPSMLLGYPPKNQKQALASGLPKIAQHVRSIGVPKLGMVVEQIFLDI